MLEVKYIFAGLHAFNFNLNSIITIAWMKQINKLLAEVKND